MENKMKKSMLAAALITVSPLLYAHSMSPAIKQYVVSQVTHHDVLLQNKSNKPECYNVFVDGKPHFNPKICLAPDAKQYIKVFVDTPPNTKVRTKVCTENAKNVNNSQRFQLCTSIVTYFPEQQLRSVSP